MSENQITETKVYCPELLGLVQAFSTSPDNQISFLASSIMTARSIVPDLSWERQRERSIHLSHRHLLLSTPTMCLVS